MQLKELKSFETLNNEELEFVIAGKAQMTHDTNTPVKRGQPGCNDTINNDSNIQDNPTQQFTR